jgi:hypothetical protein
MELAFDHIVHLVNDPVQAASRFREHGLHALEGGRHANWGTYNSLCYFDLSYIEFLGIFDRALAEVEQENLLVRDSAKRLPNQEGFSRIAIRTNDIEQTASVLKERGLQVIGPFPGSRIRPDGKRLEWSMLFVESEDSALPLPFFIQWGEADAQRRTDLEEREVIAPHAIGQLSLGAVKFAVRDLEPRVQQWSNWFGLEAGETFFDESLHAACRTLHLPGGNLLFCSPTGEGAVAEILASQGETPFALEAIGATQESIIHLSGATYECKPITNE